MNPKEDHAGGDSGPEPKGQLTEVLVEGHHDSMFVLRTGENLCIRSAGSLLVYPENVVPVQSKCRDDKPWHILVRKQPRAHQPPLS